MNFIVSSQKHKKGKTKLINFLILVMNFSILIAAAYGLVLVIVHLMILVSVWLEYTKTLESLQKYL